MNCDLTEQQLFNLLKSDDECAFGFFFNWYHGRIYDYFLYLGADEKLALGLGVDVFKRLWDLRSTLKDAQDLKSFLYLMARYRYFDEFRRVKIDTNGLENVCWKALGEVKRAIRDLSPQRKRMLRLLYIDGLAVVSIADKLGLSPQTVRNTKTDALAFLRKRLSDRDLLSPKLLPVFLHYLEVK